MSDIENSNSKLSSIVQYCKMQVQERTLKHSAADTTKFIHILS